MVASICFMNVSICVHTHTTMLGHQEHSLTFTATPAKLKRKARGKGRTTEKWSQVPDRSQITLNNKMASVHGLGQESSSRGRLNSLETLGTACVFQFVSRIFCLRLQSSVLKLLA